MIPPALRRPFPLHNLLRRPFSTSPLQPSTSKPFLKTRPNVPHFTPSTSRFFTNHYFLPRLSKPLWSLRLALITTAHIFVWTSAGIYLTKSIFPMSGPIDTRPLPIVGSPEDLAEIAKVEKAADRLKIVRALRANKNFVELQAWSGISEEEDRKRRLTTGPLNGSQRVAYYRVWLDKDDGSTVTVLSLGTGLCGFPNVVHGGMLATMLDEALGRTAINAFPGRNGVTARLEINYRRPTLAHHHGSKGGFVVLRTWMVNATERKATVKGTVEDEYGNILAESEGLFVVPKWKLAGVEEF